jgi:hypothetical protein
MALSWPSKPPERPVHRFRCGSWRRLPALYEWPTSHSEQPFEVTSVRRGQLGIPEPHRNRREIRLIVAAERDSISEIGRVTGAATERRYGQRRKAFFERSFRIVRRCLSVILLCLPLFPEPVQADVTLRYESRVTVNPGLPAELREELAKIFAGRLPPKYVQKFRNGKLYFSYGEDEAIVDFSKREITLLEGETRRYSIIPIEQYLREVVGDSALAAQTTEGGATLRSHSESIATGQTTVVSGVEAEERNILLTVDTSAATLPLVRVVIRVWNAKESEVRRVPALGEVAPYNIRISEVTNPVISLRPGFQQLPDLAEGFTSLAENFRPEDTVMRLNVKVFVPSLAAVTRELRKLPGVATPLGEGFDPDAALVEITQELTGMSSEPIPDSVFEVPASYRAVTLGELLDN